MLLTGSLGAETTSYLLEISIFSLLIYFLRHWFQYVKSTKSDIPVANQAFCLEPKIFAKLRWAVNAQAILNEAYQKFQGRVYRIDRGDAELAIVPVEFLPELNALPDSIISSREAHSYNLLGHLNGIEVVKGTDIHVKLMQSKVTPALPIFTRPLEARLWRQIESVLPKDSDDWVTFQPLDKIVRWISEAFALITFGAPLCDDPELIDLVSQQARLVFPIVIVMRLVPSVLHSTLVWLLPAKWKLEKSFKRLEKLVVPQAQHLLSQADPASAPTFLSWLIQGSHNLLDRGPTFLTKLVANIANGATHTTAMLIDNVLFDLAAHPTLLMEIREEIVEKHKEVEGQWTHAAFDHLPKLDSVLKESARFKPPSMTVYNRMMQSDYTLSDGTVLKRGQLIAVSACSVQHDAGLFPFPEKYDGLRAYQQSRKDGKAHDFKFVDGELAWGSGRWACPGRWLAILEAKIVLVKIVGELELALRKGEGRPRGQSVQEYGFMGDEEKLMVRRRKDGLGLV